MKVVKNKIAPPFKEAEFDIMFGQGISREADILDLAAKENIVEKSGAWYAYNGAKIGQGRENAKGYLRENPAVCAEIERKVREHYGLQGDVVGPVEEAEPKETASKGVASKEAAPKRAASKEEVLKEAAPSEEKKKKDE